MATGKTVFDAIKEMDEKQFGLILFRIYNAGWFDGTKTHIDRENFFLRMFPGMDSEILDIEWDDDDKVVDYLEQHEEH